MVRRYCVGLGFGLLVSVGCLPTGTDVSVQGCDQEDAKPCTCSNGSKGELSCEQDDLFCICAIKEDMGQGDMIIDERQDMAREDEG